MKRDEQRLGEIAKFDLKSDRSEVEIEFEVDLAAGHELVFLAEMPNHNNGTNISLAGLTIGKR